MSNTIPAFPSGWMVFPCFPGTKKPATGDGWPEQATDDPEQIAAWADAIPGCNWAVAMGPSGLAALDPDGAEGENSLFEFELAEGALPATRVHATPRGGRHLIFSDPNKTLRNSVGKLGNKLDTRGGNGFLVIPPSTFEGKPYVCLNDAAPAELPSFVAGVLGRVREVVGTAEGIELDSPSNVGRAARLVADYIACGDIATEGSGGDARTYELACEVLNLGLTVDKALDVMENWNAACQPPWDIDELRVKIENASQYSQNEAGAWAVPPASTTLTPGALDMLPEKSVTVREERFHWMDEGEFSNIPEPTWLIEDMLTRESVAVLYGPSGHYKSFLALHVAATVAMRGECAFYVAAEGINRMARRDFPAWKQANGIDKRLPFFMQDVMADATSGEDYAKFALSIKAKAEAEGKPVGIIFLDTLNRAMLGLEENSAKEMAMMLENAAFLKKALGCTVVLVHHTPKEGGEPRGSGALYANVDTVLFVKSEKAIHLARMFVTKQKTSEERALPFCYEGKKYGAGLAFVEVSPRDAALMSDEAELFNTKNIRAALVELKAFDPTYVSSQILIGHMVPQLEGETENQRKDALARASIALRGAIKAKRGLDGFYDGKGATMRWGLPSSAAT